MKTAVQVSKAKLVIENGGGYDGWMDKLLSGSPNSNRFTLKGFDIAQAKLPENEHVWYSIDNVATISQAITDDLKKLIQRMQQRLRTISRRSSSRFNLFSRKLLKSSQSTLEHL